MIETVIYSLKVIDLHEATFPVAMTVTTFSSAVRQVLEIQNTVSFYIERKNGKILFDFIHQKERQVEQ